MTVRISAPQDETGTAPPRPSAAVPALLEGLLAVVAAVFTVLKNDAGVLENVSGTVAGNLGDPLYFAWQLAWVAHAVTTDPGSLWTTNAFSRAPDNLAYTDTVLGYLPVDLVTGAADGGQGPALAALNIAGFAAAVLALCGGQAPAPAPRARAAGTLGGAPGF